MNSSHRHRRPRKAWAGGKHAKPSQFQNVAETAGKAAPVVEQVHYAAAQRFYGSPADWSWGSTRPTGPCCRTRT